MDKVTQRKWDHAAKNFDVMAGFGPEKRWAPAKQRLFAKMGAGKILFLAVGTGLDIRFFPPGRNIVGIDISRRMLDKAQPRAQAYDGRIQLMQADVHELPFADGEFDQIFTSCTFCSVPNPIAGLQALRRVLQPGGELHMFEHTGSRYFPFNLLMHMMTPLTRPVGPDMNRTTVENVQAAGFRLTQVTHVFLDVVKTISAVS